MSTTTQTDIAERLIRRRARMIMILATFFMVTQGAVIDRQGSLDQSLRTVDAVHISAWFVMALALLVLLMTGGGTFRSAAMRALINDESTIRNRHRALTIGFANVMVACLVIYVLSLFEAVGGRVAVHIVMTIGIGSALFVFALEELRGLKND
jgi:hypothetical protein